MSNLAVSNLFKITCSNFWVLSRSAFVVSARFGTLVKLGFTIVVSNLAVSGSSIEASSFVISEPFFVFSTESTPVSNFKSFFKSFKVVSGLLVSVVSVVSRFKRCSTVIMFSVDSTACFAGTAFGAISCSKSSLITLLIVLIGKFSGRALVLSTTSSAIRLFTLGICAPGIASIDSVGAISIFSGLTNIISASAASNSAFSSSKFCSDVEVSSLTCLWIFKLAKKLSCSKALLLSTSGRASDSEIFWDLLDKTLLKVLSFFLKLKVFSRLVLRLSNLKLSGVVLGVFFANKFKASLIYSPPFS